LYKICHPLVFLQTERLFCNYDNVTQPWFSIIFYTSLYFNRDSHYLPFLCVLIIAEAPYALRGILGWLFYYGELTTITKC
jgi:hypothetical protein